MANSGNLLSVSFFLVKVCSFDRSLLQRFVSRAELKSIAKESIKLHVARRVPACHRLDAVQGSSQVRPVPRARPTDSCHRFRENPARAAGNQLAAELVKLRSRIISDLLHRTFRGLLLGRLDSRVSFLGTLLYGYCSKQRSFATHRRGFNGERSFPAKGTVGD